MNSGRTWVQQLFSEEAVIREGRQAVKTHPGGLSIDEEKKTVAGDASASMVVD